MILRICSAGIFFLIIFIAGCLYIPPLGEQTSKEDLEKDIATLKVGTTTRAEVTEIKFITFSLWLIFHSKPVMG